MGGGVDWNTHRRGAQARQALINGDVDNAIVKRRDFGIAEPMPDSRAIGGQLRGQREPLEELQRAKQFDELIVVDNSRDGAEPTTQQGFRAARG